MYFFAFFFLNFFFGPGYQNRYRLNE